MRYRILFAQFVVAIGVSFALVRAIGGIAAAVSDQRPLPSAQSLAAYIEARR